MSDSSGRSDFEQVINRSYDIAVKHKHEYVTLEHVLLALLEFTDVQRMLASLNVDHLAFRERLDKWLEGSDYHSTVLDTSYQPKYTTNLLMTIKQAKTQSLFMGKNQMTSFDMLLAMFNNEQSYALWFLERAGVSKTAVTQYLSQGDTGRDQNSWDPDDARMLLSQYAINLNQRARMGRITPLIGREHDVSQLIEALSRKLKNNVILVGEPGVGKTQLVEGLALQISQAQVPDVLKNEEIWSLDLNSVVAGTKYRGDFEERMKNLISAIKSLPNVILFIDEIHMIVGAGSGQGSMDAANLFKPALGRGEIRTIGSTTMDEFRKHFEKDRALLRRFHRQDVEEPTPTHSKAILRGLLDGFERFHGVTYDPGCVDLAVDLAVKHLPSKRLPDKAIDLIDAAGSKVKVNAAGKQVNQAHLEEILAETAKISIKTASVREESQLANLQTALGDVLFDQDAAVKAVSEAVWLSRSGLRDSHRTMGSYLFTGPSGVGKTELAKQLAQQMNMAFVRFDMSEFMERHTVSRLIGSPPGYVGYSDGNAGSGALINALDTTPQCVLLIDEVEKAHPDVLNIFLQAMDDGRITSQNQKSVSLANAILIFTSNLGAALLSKPTLGFGTNDRSTDLTDAVNNHFSPEFRNRLDAVIAFDSLTPSGMLRVVDKFLHQLNNLSRERGVTVTVDPAAKTWLATKGHDPAMGARPLARVIDNHIKKPMSTEILFGRLRHGGSVLVTTDGDALKLDFLGVANTQDALAPALVTI